MYAQLKTLSAGIVLIIGAPIVRRSIVRASDMKPMGLRPIRFPGKIDQITPKKLGGSGREVALGALHQGATAVEAVLAAIRYSEGCGFGVDYFER